MSRQTYRSVKFPNFLICHSWEESCLVSSTAWLFSLMEAAPVSNINLATTKLGKEFVEHKEPFVSDAHREVWSISSNSHIKFEACSFPSWSFFEQLVIQFQPLEMSREDHLLFSARGRNMSSPAVGEAFYSKQRNGWGTLVADEQVQNRK